VNKGYKFQGNTDVNHQKIRILYFSHPCLLGMDQGLSISVAKLEKKFTTKKCELVE
jgi:hypothetical protein